MHHATADMYHGIFRLRKHVRCRFQMFRITGLAVGDGVVWILTHRVERDLVRVEMICYSRQGVSLICERLTDRVVAVLPGTSCQIDPALPEYSGPVKAG